MDPPLTEKSLGEEDKKSTKSDGGSNKGSPAGSRAGSAQSNRLVFQIQDDPS